MKTILGFIVALSFASVAQAQVPACPVIETNVNVKLKVEKFRINQTTGSVTSSVVHTANLTTSAYDFRDTCIPYGPFLTETFTTNVNSVSTTATLTILASITKLDLLGANPLQPALQGNLGVTYSTITPHFFNLYAFDPKLDSKVLIMLGEDEVYRGVVAGETIVERLFYTVRYTRN